MGEHKDLLSRFPSSVPDLSSANLASRNVTIQQTSGAVLLSNSRSNSSRHVFRILNALVVLAGGVALHAHPEIEDALNRLNAQIIAKPNEADLYVQRGELYAKHEEWIVAEANYLRAAELAPQHPRLPHLRGALELATGRSAGARGHLDAALDRDPANAEALVLRARAKVDLADRAAAIADFNAALALIAAPPPELFLERARLLPPADAVRSLDEGLARLGPAITLQLAAIEIEESLGRIDEAVSRINRLAAESERKESWLKRRGDLFFRAGRSSEARTSYLSALAAIHALPDWLRASPDTKQLAAELTRLATSRS
jgi:tetratricopeptide (TPR) repeat protein